jgi:arsenate reductase (thioredoxin)
MAEGLLRSRGGGSFQSFSAGTNPRNLNPLATQVMNEIGIDISSQFSKDVSFFRAEKFDWVITVCDRARESCPVFFGSNTTHWSCPDPQDMESFRKVRDELSRRIDSFLRDHSDPRS